MMRSYLDRHDDSAEPALGDGINNPHEQPAEQAALIAGSARNARHRDLLAELALPNRLTELATGPVHCEAAPPFRRAVFVAAERVPPCPVRAATLREPAPRCGSDALRQTWGPP